MKLVDIDSLFKNYVTQYLIKNKGSLENVDLDEKKEELYSLFAQTPLKELDGLTPDTYYQNKGGLVELLKAHFQQNVPVSDYLIDALILKGNESELLDLIDLSSPSDMLLIAIEALSAKNIKIDDNRLIPLLFSEKVSDEVKDEIVEIINLDLNQISNIIDAAYNSKSVSGAVCQMLSRLPVKDERIVKILIREFKNNPKKIPEYCSYIVTYGDESALEALYEAESKTRNYVDNKEIVIAIEALGGELTKKRNFTKDRDYQAIKEASKNEHQVDDDI